MIITSWQIDAETVTDFIFWGSKITADGDYSHEIKRRLLFGRKVMTNLDSIWKNKDTALPPKVRLVKAMVFPVVMYGCESWTIKKAERWRTDAFELWCWRVDCKEIQPVHPKGDQVLDIRWKDWWWSWSSITLVTWCKELIHWKRPWCWARLKAEGVAVTSDEMAGWHHQLNGHESEQAPGVGGGQGSLMCWSSWCLRVMNAWTTGWLTEPIMKVIL